MTTALRNLIQRWNKEATHWQNRADSAGRVRRFATAYEYMTKSEQYASCAAQLENALDNPTLDVGLDDHPEPEKKS